MANTALAVVPGDGAELPMSLQVQQRESLKAAGALASEVTKIVKANGLSRSFGKGGREHVFIEGWLTISRVNNEQPHAEVKDVRKDPETGVEVIHARAWITDANDRIVSEADGYCSSEEGNWNGKPFYARASMAQTRALGKAMRLRHAWVMVMAGFAPTPAEEMDGVIDATPAAPAQEAPKPVKLKVVKKEAAPAPEPVVIPEKEDDNMALEVVFVKGYSNPKPYTKNGVEKFRAAALVRLSIGEEVWVTCWTEKLYNAFKANKEKNVLLQYEVGEWNGKPQYTAHDVQEAK